MGGKTNREEKKASRSRAKELKDVGKDRPVIHPAIKVEHCYDEELGGVGPMTVDQAKRLLKWETEDEYRRRMMLADKTLTEKEAVFKEVTLTYRDAEGKVVRVCCWNNSRNRPLDERHAAKLSQDHLRRRWKLNLENVIIGRTGLVISGAHRMIGLVQAGIEWAGKNAATWRKFWPEEPTMSTLVAFGGDESKETVSTIDNVKPRSESDVIYTCGMFDGRTGAERHELSKMLASATDLMWRRARDPERNTLEKYQTHSSSMDFIDRHKRLLECVAHCFGENKERGISGLHLSAGQVAAMMYLMAASDTDEEAYHNAKPTSEKGAEFNCWDLAASFVTELAKGDRGKLRQVPQSLASFYGVDGSGAGPTTTEKLAVLVLAWRVFREGGEPTLDDLSLAPHRIKTKSGDMVLHPIPSVGGIDLGDPAAPEPKTGATATDEPADDQTEAAEDDVPFDELAVDDDPEMTDEDMEAAKEEQRHLRADEAAEERRLRAERVQAKLAEAQARRDEAARQRTANPAPNNRLGGLGTTSDGLGTTSGISVPEAAAPTVTEAADGGKKNGRRRAVVRKP